MFAVVLVFPPVTCPLPVPPVSEPLSSSQQSDEIEDAKWSCSACTFDNYPALKQCEMCEMPRIPSSTWFDISHQVFTVHPFGVLMLLVWQ